MEILKKSSTDIGQYKDYLYQNINNFIAYKNEIISDINKCIQNIKLGVPLYKNNEAYDLLPELTHFHLNEKYPFDVNKIFEEHNLQETKLYQFLQIATELESFISYFTAVSIEYENDFNLDLSDKNKDKFINLLERFLQILPNDLDEFKSWIRLEK